MAHSYVWKEILPGGAFDPLTLNPAAPFTQAAFYGRWHESLGRRVRRFEARSGGRLAAAAQFIELPLAAGKKYIYAPYGPVAAEADEEFAAACAGYFEKILAADTALVFARFDFTLPAGRGGADLERYFRRAPRATGHGAYFQPRFEWAVPLLKPEGGILAAMHEKARYNIRLALRKGVETEIIGKNLSPHLEPFYGILAVTAHRDGFRLAPRAYYEAALRTADEERNAFLVVARYRQEVVGMYFIVRYGGTANYVFGGSSGKYANVMHTYAAQWAAMRQAKALGCASYNFGAVEESGLRRADPRLAGSSGGAKAGSGGRWSGITDFKRKFGGGEVRHGELRDLVGSRLWYGLYVARKTFQGIYR